MTLLLVAPLRLSLKDKRKENIPLQAVIREDEQVRMRTQISNLLHAKGHCCIPPSHAGFQKLYANCQAQKARSVELLVVAPPIVLILILLICLLLLNHSLVLLILALTLCFIRRRVTCR